MGEKWSRELQSLSFMPTARQKAGLSCSTRKLYSLWMGLKQTTNSWNSLKTLWSNSAKLSGWPTTRSTMGAAEETAVIWCTQTYSTRMTSLSRCWSRILTAGLSWSNLRTESRLIACFSRTMMKRFSWFLKWNQRLSMSILLLSYSLTRMPSFTNNKSIHPTHSGSGSLWEIRSTWWRGIIGTMENRREPQTLTSLTMTRKQSSNFCLKILVSKGR